MSKFEEHLNKLKQVKKFLSEKKAIEYIKKNKIGVQFEDGYEIEYIDSNKFAEIDPNEVYYYYDGPLDEKTRDFCKELLLLGKFFTQDDIDKLSSKAGYNVDLYMGSYNCRHDWKRARIKGRIKEGYVPDTPTGTEINRIGRDSINNQ